MEDINKKSRVQTFSSPSRNPPSRIKWLSCIVCENWDTSGFKNGKFIFIELVYMPTNKTQTLVIYRLFYRWINDSNMW